jgi:hypothetical protein
MFHEMWSDVGKKAHPHELWHVIDHHTGQVLASVFGWRWRGWNHAQGSPVPIVTEGAGPVTQGERTHATFSVLPTGGRQRLARAR